jgi:hypothetical protein
MDTRAPTVNADFKLPDLTPVQEQDAIVWEDIGPGA